MKAYLITGHLEKYKGQATIGILIVLAIIASACSTHDLSSSTTMTNNQDVGSKVIQTIPGFQSSNVDASAQPTGILTIYQASAGLSISVTKLKSCGWDSEIYKYFKDNSASSDIDIVLVKVTTTLGAECINQAETSSLKNVIKYIPNLTNGTIPNIPGAVLKIGKVGGQIIGAFINFTTGLYFVGIYGNGEPLNLKHLTGLAVEQYEKLK
ncbi:MAG: hypothetical protein HKL80_11825 [Acidimicrobiales bacterium]|nr:hypothetical protein [Acidimicrobiales bacterium]